MNYKMIRFVISWVLKVEGMLMLFPALVGAMYQEKTGFAYLIWGLLCIAAGLILCFRKPSNMEIYSRDGFVCVSLSWVVLGVFGAVPFVITGEIPFYINALFEIVSGFTTTGASILSDVEALSHASLFWRSFSHWIGGMGVLVFILALLPMKGGSVMNLMKAESRDRLFPNLFRECAEPLNSVSDLSWHDTFYHCCPAAFRHEDI